jgi:transposase
MTMAMQVQWERIGADVSQAEVVIARTQGPVITLENRTAVLNRWLRTLPGPTQIAVEATGTYHLALIEAAHELGHQIYLIDGLRLSRYRDSIGGRAKTDRTDAQLLLRYLLNEGRDLTVWIPPPKGYTTLLSLLRRRAKVVQTRTTLRQSLAGLPELKASARSVLERLKQLERLMEKKIIALARATECADQVRRCQAIEGIGPINAVALANAFRRGNFANSDAFIAFLGMDVRVSDSGKHVGRRKLTKKGDFEIRRLLYNAAMAASRSERWQPTYQAYLARGLKTTQALVALARKLARIAFALMKNQSDYRVLSTPVTTCGQT